MQHISAGKEAHIWQVVGWMAISLGLLLLGSVIAVYGVAYADTSALGIGLAASFVILCGSACVVAGRVLHAIFLGEKTREAYMWRTLAAVCCGAGLVVMFHATTESWGQKFTIDTLAQHLAGAFTITVGLVVVLGQRVMHHATDHLRMEREKTAEVTMQFEAYKSGKHEAAAGSGF